MLFAKNSNAGEYLDMMLEWMGTKTFINRTAAELIFEGYDDELLAMAEWAGEDVESMKFGWFHGVSLFLRKKTMESLFGKLVIGIGLMFMDVFICKSFDSYLRCYRG